MTFMIFFWFLLLIGYLVLTFWFISDLRTRERSVFMVGYSIGMSTFLLITTLVSEIYTWLYP